MINTIISRACVSSKNKDYAIEIAIENRRVIVRKIEILSGIDVPLDETYTLNIEDAEALQTLLIIQITGFSPN